MHKSTAYLVATAVLLALIAAKYDPATGFTKLIRFGDTSSARKPDGLRNVPVATIPGSNGYDGQFYAQIALDPLLRDPSLPTALDAPAYRARRILVPATAAVLGFGRPSLVLQVYALINLACWLGLSWLLYRRLAAQDHAFARWFGCMFALGTLESVRQSLVDLPALLLLALSIEAYERSKQPASTAWAALGALAKETNLVGSLALLADPAVPQVAWPRAAGRAVVAAVPLALWLVYVHSVLGNDRAGSGIGNFTWPGAGLLMQLASCGQSIMRGDLDSRYTFGLLGTGALAFQSISLWQHRRPTSAWWRVGIAYSALMLFLGPWVWNGYWAAYRVMLPMTVAFNLLLPGSSTFWIWWAIGNIALVHGVWRFL